MKKTKAQKGITLIALIITIVVLLILAVVAISSIQNDGILLYAQNAAKDYNQAQVNEQEILDGYLSHIPGNSASTGAKWTQSGTTVTNGTVILAVGDSVTVQVGEGEAEAYSANNVNSWNVLGAENGKLLLVSTSCVDTVALGGKEGGNIDGVDCVAGYNNGVDYLNGICENYLNTTYADEARSINIEDINRIASFEPNSSSNADYGTEYTYTSGEHPTKGTASESNPITEISTYYLYSISKNTVGEVAYELLRGKYYWLASTYVDAEDGFAVFGFHHMEDVYKECKYIWDSSMGASSYETGVRAVVSLKSDVTVTKS